jgi:hypothetical protein
MKITETNLRTIIKEELKKLKEELFLVPPPKASWDSSKQHMASEFSYEAKKAFDEGNDEKFENILKFYGKLINELQNKSRKELMDIVRRPLGVTASAYEKFLVKYAKLFVKKDFFNFLKIAPSEKDIRDYLKDYFEWASQAKNFYKEQEKNKPVYSKDELEKSRRETEAMYGGDPRKNPRGLGT